MSNLATRVLRWVLLATLAATPLVLACGGDSEPPSTPTSTLSDTPSPAPTETASTVTSADFSRIVREYERTVLNEQYALETWGQSPQEARDGYVNNISDTLDGLAGVTGVDKYRDAASFMADFAAFIGSVNAFNYSQLMFHSGLAYDVRAGLGELADLMDAGEDYSNIRARLRTQMVRLRGHVESYVSERLEGSLDMKQAARAAASKAVDSTASFLDGLAATLAAAGTS